MVPCDSTPLSHKPYETIHKDVLAYNQLFNELNNRPYLSYEWEMKMKKKHMDKSIIIMEGQGWENLIFQRNQQQLNKASIHHRKKMHNLTKNGK